MKEREREEGEDHDETSMKLRQPRELSSSRKSIKLVSGARKDSTVERLRLLECVPEDLLSLLACPTGVGVRPRFTEAGEHGGGMTRPSSSFRTDSRSTCSSATSSTSSSSSSSLMDIKLRGRDGLSSSSRTAERERGPRPSNAASASERLRLRVLMVAVERVEGVALSGDLEGGG